MSSYFDTMASCVYDPKYIVELVRRQYKWYLRKVLDEALTKEKDKVMGFMRKFDAIKEEKDPGREIQEIHTFAHNLASAGIRLRGGRRAMDNPPIPY